MSAHGIDDDLSGRGDLMAAEYVLGVLDADARRNAQARIEREPVFAAEVARWEARFAPWLETVAPVPAPNALWPRIEAALWGKADTAPAVPMWQRLGFWRGLTAGGFAVAAASLVAVVVLMRQIPPPAPAPVAVVPGATRPLAMSLKHDDGSTAFTATLDPATGTMVLVPVQLQGDASTSPELWLIPPGDHPHSLGMIVRDHAMTVNIPAALRQVSADSLFAISLEPAGSSAHPAPTGPVVAKGSAIRI